jgi:uncharacterized SAM-binding protein YcdF (DUF218 family)
MLLALATLWLCMWGLASLATWGFYHWIDLRFAGPVIASALPIAWSLSVPAYALARWRWDRPEAGREARSPTQIRRLAVLLWPTYLMLACLLANTVYYFRLKCHGAWEGTWVPITLLGLAVLGGWALAARRDLTRLRDAGNMTRPLRAAQALAENGGEVARRGRSAGWLAVTALGIGALVVGWFFFWQFRSDPPPEVTGEGGGGGADVAVVLGNGVYPDGRPTRLLADRVAAGVALYRQGRARHLLMSGAIEKFPSGDVSEAVVMMHEALQQGVPAEAIVLDPVGVNTRATAQNAVAVMRARGWRTAVGVSDDSHLQRVKLAFRQQGMPIWTYACAHEAWSPADLLWLARELVGNVVYRLAPGYHSTPAGPVVAAAPRIVVYKSQNKLEFYDGPRLVKEYPCITGKGTGDKLVEGDKRTPEGTFHIVVKNPRSKYHLSMGLDYPDRAAAQRGLSEKRITQQQYESILHGLATSGIPDWGTPLGGEIFLHGHAEGRQGTAGCVALSNADIEELYAACELGTPVEIKP